MGRTAAQAEVGSSAASSAGLRARFLAFANHRLLFGIVACYLVFGFAASVFIPPWQSPDEPAHFEQAMLTPYGTTAELPDVQQPIIRTFKTFRFYEYRRLPTLENEPTSFSAISWVIIRQVGKTPLYYQLAWLAASWTNDTILQLYSMRWLSVVLSALTIPLVYAVVRELLPERPMLALLAAAFVALLPMYGYIGASVNPDTIGAPVAAACVLFAVRAVQGKRVFASLILALLAAALAVFVRRSSFVLLPWALLVTAWILFPILWRRLPKIIVLAGSAMLSALVVAVVAWPSQLAADWYPYGTTRVSLADGGFEGRRAFSLAAQAGGSPSIVSYQIPRYQLEHLRGATLNITAEVRGGAGAIALSSLTGELASLPVTPTPDWKEISFQASVPGDAQALFITIAGTSTAATAFDAIRAISMPSGEQVLVSNGGAEDAYTWWQARFLSQPIADYTIRIVQAVRLGTYTSPRAWELYPWYLQNLSSSFIGRFGWMAFGVPAWIENGLRLLALVLVAGIVLAWRRTTETSDGVRHALLLLALLLIGGVLTLLLEYTQYLSEAAFPQGRYLFPFLAAIAALMVCGLAQWLPQRFDRAAALVGTSMLLALNLWCWFGLIIPFFYE